MKEETKKGMLEILKNYGLMTQLKYFQTEVFELNEAIISKNSISAIAEEIADVMCMLKQFQYYFDIQDDEINKIIDYKVQRQLNRIKGKGDD